MAPNILHTLFNDSRQSLRKDKLLRGTVDGAAGTGLLIFAQLLVLTALCLGLQFIVRTTGGSLFLAASLAPALSALAIVLGGGILIYKYTRRHSLFLSEEFEPGEIIFRTGDTSDCAYFIKSGQVDVIREENHSEVILATLSEGEYFGEMALLSNTPRNATVRARTRTVAEVVGKENFLAMVNAVRSAREDVMSTVGKRSSRSAKGGSSVS
jgi:hypothetical protein